MMRGMTRLLCVMAALLLVITGCADDSPPASPGGQATGKSIVGVIARVEPSVVTIRHENGVGSGVVYKPDGIIVTNAHVVGERQRVRVVFADGSETDGRMAGTDEVTDLAVVRVDRTGLPAAQVRSELPRAGETALAIGSPLGFANTVTRGIISGVGRQIPAFNDMPVETVGDVYAALREAEPGDTATVEVGRGVETVRVDVTLGMLGR